jgi:hypothetical protein
MTQPGGRTLVAMYLYLDASGRTVPPHPSVRTGSPERYLECALVQAASLRLGRSSCEIALIGNVEERTLGRRARRLWRALRSLEVEIRPSDTRLGAGGAAGPILHAAIRGALAGTAEDTEVWLPNLDCVWVRPALAFAAAPAPGQIGCLRIPYPPDWRVGGPAEIGDTREALGRTAAAMGSPPGPPPWLGGDLLVGRPSALGGLLESFDRLQERLAPRHEGATNEQLLSLASALGLIATSDLSPVARRIQTGARHDSPAPPDASALGIWHLPAEKGLSMRRAATGLARGRPARLRADLTDPERAMRRFNVGVTTPGRRLRDGAWLAARRLLEASRPSRQSAPG